MTVSLISDGMSKFDIVAKLGRIYRILFLSINASILSHFLPVSIAFRWPWWNLPRPSQTLVHPTISQCLQFEPWIKPKSRLLQSYFWVLSCSDLQPWSMKEWSPTGRFLDRDTLIGAAVWFLLPSSCHYLLDECHPATTHKTGGNALQHERWLCPD